MYISVYLNIFELLLPLNVKLRSHNLNIFELLLPLNVKLRSHNLHD